MSNSHDVHWREYPIGFPAELARAFRRTLLPLLAGVGIAFALILASGLLGEEGMIDLELAQTLDLLTRMSMAVLLCVAYLAWVAVAVIEGLREITTSKALDNAALSSAADIAVPHPSQIEDVITPPGRGALVLSWVNIGIGVLVLIIGLSIIAEHDEGKFIALTAAAWIALMVGCILLINGKLRSAHERRRDRIAAHWTNKREVAAWRAARDAREKTATSNDTVDQCDRLRLANTLTGAGTVATGVALMSMYGYMFVRFPEASRSSAGPRARYSETFELVLDSAMWISAGAVFVALALFLAGALLEGAAHAVERAGLRRALENPDAARPPKSLLARYAERQPLRLAQVAAAISGIALIVATATLLLGSFEMAIFEDAVATFAPLTRAAAITVVIAVALFIGALIANAISNIRGQQLRNALMRRWPTPPPRNPDSEGKVAPVRKGPALSRK